jgi:hypothetical protein
MMMRTGLLRAGPNVSRRLSSTVSTAIAKEDFGVLDCYRPPKQVLFKPSQWLKYIFHRGILTRLALFSFKRSIKPQTLSASSLKQHAVELRDATRLAHSKGDIKTLRNLCGQQVQSQLIRNIKDRKHKEVPLQADRVTATTLLNFMRQPVDAE